MQLLITELAFGNTHGTSNNMISTRSTGANITIYYSCQEISLINGIQYHYIALVTRPN
jgi:hypothetical protein